MHYQSCISHYTIIIETSMQLGYIRDDLDHVRDVNDIISNFKTPSDATCY